MAAQPSIIEPVTQFVQNVLQPAVVYAIRAKGGRDVSHTGEETKTHDVFFVRITCPKPMSIVGGDDEH